MSFFLRLTDHYVCASVPWAWVCIYACMCVFIFGDLQIALIDWILAVVRKAMVNLGVWVTL